MALCKAGIALIGWIAQAALDLATERDENNIPDPSTRMKNWLEHHKLSKATLNDVLRHLDQQATSESDSVVAGKRGVTTGAWKTSRSVAKSAMKEAGVPLSLLPVSKRGQGKKGQELDSYVDLDSLLLEIDQQDTDDDTDDNE